MSNIHSKEYKEMIGRLIKARKDAGYTQVEVAKKLKRTQSYISKIEKCERRLDILEFKLIINLYGITATDIIS